MDPSRAPVGGPKLGPSGPKPEIWDPKKFSKSKSVLPKMSARSGLVGKNPPGPIWGHPGQFSMVRNKKEQKKHITTSHFLVLDKSVLGQMEVGNDSEAYGFVQFEHELISWARQEGEAVGQGRAGRALRGE